MPRPYHCPNSKTQISPTAESCPSCQASFGEGSVWTPETEPSRDTRPAGAASVVFAAVGISLLLATFFPMGSRVLQGVTDGMYGPVFKPYSPALFILLSYVSNYLPLCAVAWFLLRHFRVMHRVPPKYRSVGLYSTGVALILFYSTARVLAATVPGGGAGFAVASLSPFILLPALVLLVVAVIRLCIGYGKGAV